MQIKLEIKGLDKVQATLRKLSGNAVKEAAVKAINDTAFVVRKEMQREMSQVFDRPTPYVLNAVRVNPATVDKPWAIVSPEQRQIKGVDPQNILRASEQGGQRKLKRSERALQQAGLLPSGYFTVIPKDPFPGSDDARGNLRGPFMVQLLSYFHAFAEQGYKANMSDKRRAKMHNVGRSANGHKTINGVSYFVTYGGMRSGAGQHLRPGIWAKSGTHGANVRPVLMFVRAPAYKAVISMDAIVKRAGVQGHFERRMRFRIRQAAGV